MGIFGFQRPPGQAPQMAQPATAPASVVPSQADPSSQYLAQALQAMGSHPQGNATGLAANLMSEALMRYGQGLRQQGQQPAFNPGPLSPLSPISLVPPTPAPVLNTNNGLSNAGLDTTLPDMSGVTLVPGS